ncbi:hypothetical protein RBB84_02510 [Rhodococcus sp. D-6]|uniref:Uncharacterized protein n=1 Tax=Rhodococcus sp. D-6 TaxID=1387842 RepID=A0AAU7UYB4_9NOCA|nr:hypothetical protein [Rhodococcus sp. HS-D2]
MTATTPVKSKHSPGHLAGRAVKRFVRALNAADDADESGVRLTLYGIRFDAQFAPDGDLDLYRDGEPVETFGFEEAVEHIREAVRAKIRASN